MRRLDGGLFILQLVDYVLLEACNGCPPTVKQRVTRILAQRRASLKTIRHIMRGESRSSQLRPGDNAARRPAAAILPTSLTLDSGLSAMFAEYAGNLGDAGDNEWREAEQQHILQLIDKF